MAELIYVDNSNLWIEGMRVAAIESGKAASLQHSIANKICDYDWKYDFGKLLYLAGGEQKNIKRAVLFGSRPPKNDSLWQLAQAKGFEPITYDRNAANKEKKIDTDITATVLEDSYEIYQPGDNITLIAGDGDYIPLIEKLHKRKISIHVMFWAHASREIKDAVGDKFFNLNPYLNTIRI